ncbi:MAG: hypothetical protein A2285_06000 [Elusimicrobia bacterium RIFOXYA12_FULL_57_11]|nr:MAG: hypothetical protein A2285_06000 [Elusimicrobia bacterium RIFOXYA12_FULL_57_11]
MHHQVGVMYMKMHDHLIRTGRPAEAEKYLDMALARFELYEKVDPVYPMNYYRKAQLRLMRQDLPGAEKEYSRNLNAWKCFVKGHLHDTPDAYFNLGNVQYGQRKFREAAESYRKALEKDPNYEQAKRNLAIALSQLPFGQSALK